MLTSPLAVDAEPFATVLEALHWAVAAMQERGSGAWMAHAIPHRPGAVARPCEPIDIVRVCDMVIEKYDLDHHEQTLIVCAGLGTLDGAQLASAAWRRIEDRLAYYLADRGILTRDWNQR